MKTSKYSLINHDRKLVKNSAGLIGIDEAGRGAFAGPVVAAAAWLSEEFYKVAKKLKNIEFINDSKQLTAIKREELFLCIKEWENQGLIQLGWAESSVEEIEKHNILGATRLAMRRALQTLLPKMPESFRVSEICELELWDRLDEEKKQAQTKILIDGLPLTPFEYPHHAIIEGDGKSLAIAIASIVAKVNRDRLMIDLSKKYCDYGFENHKGYGTEFHRQALIEKGETEIHRKKFLTALRDKFIDKDRIPLVLS